VKSTRRPGSTTRAGPDPALADPALADPALADPDDRTDAADADRTDAERERDVERETEEAGLLAGDQYPIM
jgi:hypothetical protein